MSRIHEALKRAEQEREGSGSTDRGTAPVPVSPDQTMPAFEMEPGGAVAAVAAAGIGHQVNGPTTFESHRCAQHAWKMDREHLVFCDSPNHSVGSEQFRTLRTRLYQVQQKNAIRTLLVSSALMGEGKTIVSANLAHVFVRQHGRRVLLIDADLRRSELHNLLGTCVEPGLTNYLRNEVDEYAIIQRGQIENLFFIPGGSNVSNPTELLANGRLKQLLHRLRDAFDWIILDSAPIIPVSDTNMVAEPCDGILLVVRASVTPLEMVQKAQQEFRNKPLLGVVLNRAENDSRYGSYYYSDPHSRRISRQTQLAADVE